MMCILWYLLYNHKDISISFYKAQDKLIQIYANKMLCYKLQQDIFIPSLPFKLDQAFHRKLQKRFSMKSINEHDFLYKVLRNFQGKLLIHSLCG